MSESDPLAEFVRTQIEVEHARCDAIRNPPPGQYSKSPLAEALRETAGVLQSLAFAAEDILGEYEAMRAGVDAAEGTVLAGAARVRLGAYRRCLQAVASTFQDRDGWRKEWGPQ